MTQDPVQFTWYYGESVLFGYWTHPQKKDTDILRFGRCRITEGALHQQITTLSASQNEIFIKDRKSA